MKCTAWVLAVSLGAMGCGPAGDADPATADSVPARAPVTTDTTGAAAVAATADRLRAALELLLRGPTAPQPDRYSWFSTATADALRSVSVDAAGHATVDFEDLRALIPNASSSAGSAMLLDELNTTVFSVAGVRSVDYLIEGACERFWEWLQYSCQIVQKP